MNRTYVFRLTFLVFAQFVFVSLALAGGWAIITLKDLPDYVIAGKPINLTFAVRQHGVTLLAGLDPSVRAKAPSGLVTEVPARASANRGEYTAALSLPEPGEWTITIASGFGESAVTLPSLRVVSGGTTLPAPFAPATRGVRLFTAKGCIGCHRHVEVNPQRSTEARFDLTGKRFPPEYLKKFLADPSIKPAEMPNLKLTDSEIDALAAFINKAVMKQQAREGDIRDK